MRRQVRPPRQSGIGLLLLLVLSGVLALVVILNLLPKQPTEQERERLTQIALARAKEALISYAVNSMDQAATVVPGYLPCPADDVLGGPNEEGNTKPVCGSRNVTVLGLLPFKSLGIEPLRDGWGECLWYAVSGTFKSGDNATKAEMVNWDTAGQIEVLASDGVTLLAGGTPDARAAAVVIADRPLTDIVAFRTRHESPQSG